MSDIKKRIVPLVIVTGLLVGGYLVDKSRAAQRSALSGTFESQPSLLAPQTAGRVSRIFVREGQAVKKGQALVTIDAPDTGFDAVASQALAEQAKAKADLAVAGSRSEDIARQRAVVSELDASLRKLRNGSLPEEIRLAEARVAQAKQRYLAQVRGSRPEQIAEARAAERQAFARLQQVRRGPNAEEKAQLKAALDAAEANVTLAKGDLDRLQKLADEGAISVQEARNAQNKYDNALAARTQAAEALRRANLGSPREETAQAEAAHRQAQAELDLAVAGPRSEDVLSAKEDLRIAQENLALVRRGARDEDIDAAQARLEQARVQLQELQAGNRPEDVHQAEAADLAAKAQSQSVASKAAERTVYAPHDGVIERVLVADGDLVSASVPVVQFTDPTDIWLRTYVPEQYLPQIHVGDLAKVAVDGIPDLVAARVDTIATQGEFTPVNLQTPDERGRQVFAVRLRLAAPNPRIRAGQAATVKSIGGWTP